MKNLFKKVLKLTIICSLLVLSSCEKDLYEDSIQNSNRNKINLNQFKNETQINDFNTIFKVPVSVNGMLNRTAELSEFVIDTVAIQRYVSENNKITYSFRVYTMVSSVQLDEKYNLVYTKENNIWEKSIIAFKERIGATSAENQFEEYQKLYDSRFTNTTMSSNIEACISESYFIQCDGSCSGQCDGFACPTGQCIQHVITVEQCLGSGGGPSDPNGNDPAYNGPGAYDPLNPFTFTPNLFENPVFDDPNYINAVKGQYFFDHLDYAGQIWATENALTYIQLIHYQIQNNWSSQSNYFAIEMMNALMNNEEVDMAKNIIYTINKPCQKQIVKDIINICSPFTEQIYQTFNSTEKVNLKFYNGTIPSGNPAQTNNVIEGTSNNFTIKIKFDDNYLNSATDLSIVAVTLHELVHAYLMNLYMKNQLVATDSSYNSLLNAFINFYKDADEETYATLDLEIHNAMKSFISKMANSIYNYAVSKNMTGVNADYCEHLAWGTMNGTNLFQTTLTTQQQHDYETITAIEQDNLASAKGNPCN